MTCNLVTQQKITKRTSLSQIKRMYFFSKTSALFELHNYMHNCRK